MREHDSLSMNWLFSLFRGRRHRDRESDKIVAEARLKVDLQQRTDSIEELHTGPRGGRYSIDAKGRRRYVKA